MKCEITGKVVNRTHRATPKGELGSLEIEEPGLFPSVFQVSSRDVTLFGKPDGPFAVGRIVRVTAFANGRMREVVGKDGKKFKAYSVWFTASRIEPVAAAVNNGGIGSPAPTISDSAAQSAVSQDPEDLPF